MGRFKRGFCGWLMILGLFGGIAAHAEAPIWAITGAKNTVYLAGFVRLLPQADPQLPAAFNKAYADSAALVMEIRKEELNPSDVQGLALMAGMLTGDESLSHLIGQARFDKLVKQAEGFGVPNLGVGLERFQPWLAAQTVHQMQLKTLGHDPKAGVEMQILERAKSDHKEITGFETPEEQIVRLAKLPIPQQIEFLDVTLVAMQDEQRKLNDVASVWRSGNSSKLASLLSAEYQQAPTLYTTLVSDRSRKWVPQIERMLKSDKNHMVVVGTLNIVGKNGLLELLKAKGFTSRQLQ